MNYEIVQLRNGAFSLRSLAHGEIMHPAIGPVAEAEALYVEQLQIRQRAAERTGPFVVWDVGLGAAANAIAVLKAVGNRDVLLLSFDSTTDPIRFALEHVEQLAYLKPFRGHLETLITVGEASFDRVKWHLHLGNFPDLLSGSRHEPRSSGRESAPSEFPKSQSRLTPAATTHRNLLPAPDAILFDPYSPAKNPEMWTAQIFARTFQLLERPCSLANFSRSTMFRVSLLLAGFYVGRGEPIARKEETTIAANTLSLIRNPLDARWLERAQRSHSAEPLWTPDYRKAPLAPSTLERLRAHPQFSR